MRKEEIRGIIVPVVTPMNADETINGEELCRQIDRMIDCGVNGIFCLGTNGEAFALSRAEKEQVIRLTVRHVNGRVPVYAGTGCITTGETISLSRFAEQAGADALSVITPYFSAVTQQQLLDYYGDVARSVALPVIVYNIPARTGVNVAPETWEALSRTDGICGIKDSSGKLENMTAYMERGLAECAVLAGNDSLILPSLLAGGRGAIAGCANVYPRTIVGLYRAFAQGEHEKARALQDSLAPFRALFRYGNSNTVIKLAMNQLGYRVGACRKPFDSISPEGMEALRAVLDENRSKGME